MQLFCKLIIFILIISQLGCATIFKGSSQKIAVNSTPLGARVYIDNLYLGETPLIAKLKLNKSHRIEFKQEGYKDSESYLQYSIGAGWLTADLVFSVLLTIPLIVDGITGSWNYFDQSEINAPLEKVSLNR
jgi:hypothetical protein